MPISVSALRAAAAERPTTVASNLTEAKSRGLRTAFLCHSHHDRDLAKGLQNMLLKAGWQVYIDWDDASMPATPNRETAARIQTKIVDLYYFLYLATANSAASRWCPWEIGYADGKKPIEQILIVPTNDGVNTHGNEYLQLYRRVDLSDQQQLAAWRPGQSTHGVLVGQL